MPEPTNPDKIIIKNKYYPSGLTTGMIYNHYINNKKDIIKNADGRPVIFFMKLDEKSDIVVKRLHNNSKIILTNENYDSLMSGYIIGLSCETAYKGDIIKEVIIDIDPLKSNMSLSSLKSHTMNLIKYIDLNTIYQITNGRKGFHVRIKIPKQNRKSVYDDMLNILKDKLKNHPEYVVENSKIKDNNVFINCDLTPIRNKGSIAVINGLNRNGLICMDITKNFNSYKFTDSIIK